MKLEESFLFLSSYCKIPNMRLMFVFMIRIGKPRKNGATKCFERLLIINYASIEFAAFTEERNDQMSQPRTKQLRVLNTCDTCK